MPKKPERFPGWDFVKRMWGAMLDRDCVQDIMREKQTPPEMLRVRMLTALLNEEFIDRENDLRDERKRVHELKENLADLNAKIAKLTEE